MITYFYLLFNSTSVFDKCTAKIRTRYPKKSNVVKKRGPCFERTCAVRQSEPFPSHVCQRYGPLLFSFCPSSVQRQTAPNRPKTWQWTTRRPPDRFRKSMSSPPNNIRRRNKQSPGRQSRWGVKCFSLFSSALNNEKLSVSYTFYRHMGLNLPKTDFYSFRSLIIERTNRMSSDKVTHTPTTVIYSTP